MSKKRAPWGHMSRSCVVCRRVGPRVRTPDGFAHRKCADQRGYTAKAGFTTAFYAVDAKAEQPKARDRARRKGEGK